MTKNHHEFNKVNISIDDEKIESYAEKYIELRSHIIDPESSLKDHHYFKDIEFSTEEIRNTIKKYTKPERTSKQPYRDIYRSDLGELILVSYFDKLYPNDGKETFIIPLKNIWDRELNDSPGRGLDATGYKILDDNELQLLIGEGKVSAQSKNPPDVVDSSGDSIYKTQIKYKDKDYLAKRLANVTKKLNPAEAKYFNIMLVAIDHDLEDTFSIVYGCCLVRDEECVDFDKDYGKLKSNKNEFEPDSVHFVIPTFDLPIKETVDKFHEKVNELISSN